MLKIFACPGGGPCRARVRRLGPDRPAANYPNRTVKIVVSAPPGGGVDIVARVIADRLSKLWASRS